MPTGMTEGGVVGFPDTPPPYDKISHSTQKIPVLGNFHSTGEHQILRVHSVISNPGTIQISW